MSSLVETDVGRTVAKFGLVGFAVTALYAIISTLLHGALGMDQILSSVLAYTFCSFVSYFAHQNLTFQAAVDHHIQGSRFAVLTMVGFSVATLVPLLNQYLLGGQPIVGFLAVCVVIPAVNFVVMRNWVFADTVNTVSRQWSALARQVLFGIAIVTVAALSCAFPYFYGTNTDTSWLLTVLDQLATGKRLYVDIVELNPVFSIWLYAIPHAAARAVGTAPEFMVHLYVLVICFLGSLATAWILVSSNAVRKQQALLIIAVLFAIAVLPVGQSFSQRDHIGGVLVWPLLALAGWRANASIANRPAARHVIVCGLLASVLPLAKIYYAIIFLALAVFIAVSRRDVRAVLLPEFVIAGMITVIYSVTFYALYPEFFNDWLPLLQETYMAFRRPFMQLLSVSHSIVIVAGFVLVFWRHRLRDPLLQVLLIASLAAWIPFFLQGKGWIYHQMVAIQIGLIALVLPLLIRSKSNREKASEASDLKDWLAVSTVFLIVVFPFYQSPMPDRAAIEELARDHRGASVSLVGRDIASAHPLTRMLGGKWNDLYCSDWLIGYAEVQQHRSNPERAAHFSRMIENYLSEKLKRLQENPPEILLIGSDGGLMAQVLRDDPEWAAFFASYQSVGKNKATDIMKRREKLALSPASASD